LVPRGDEGGLGVVGVRVVVHVQEHGRQLGWRQSFG